MNRFHGLAPAPRLTDEAYHLLNELVETELGMHFPPHRRAILEARLQPRLLALHVDNFLDYYTAVRARGNGELTALASAVTNNETYFFREPAQMRGLYGEGLELLRPSLAVPGRLRLLSAGCSSGEEAFTLSFFAHDGTSRLRDVSVRVDAFDLDSDRVGIARRGACRQRSLRDMTAAQIGRYLAQTAAERYEVKPVYRERVRFAVGNIVRLETFRNAIPYDAVFCRNVLIYFSQAALELAVTNFVHVLRPGGLLFLGHAESIIGRFPELETVRIGGCIAYRKVGG